MRLLRLIVLTGTLPCSISSQASYLPFATPNGSIRLSSRSCPTQQLFKDPTSLVTYVRNQLSSTDINSLHSDSCVHTGAAVFDVPITASLLPPLFRPSSSTVTFSKHQCFKNSLHFSISCIVTGSTNVLVYVRVMLRKCPPSSYVSTKHRTNVIIQTCRLVAIDMIGPSTGVPSFCSGAEAMKSHNIFPKVIPKQ